MKDLKFLSLKSNYNFKILIHLKINAIEYI